MKTCPGCTGTGVVTSPVWQMFFDECRAGEWVDPDEWARRNGYGHSGEMGPEEIECETCGGTGAIALEQEAKAVYDGYMASPSPDRLLNAIDRAVSSDVADVSRLMSAISDGDVETIGKIVLRLYDHEAWLDAKYAAERNHGRQM